MHEQRPYRLSENSPGDRCFLLESFPSESKLQESDPVEDPRDLQPRQPQDSEQCIQLSHSILVKLKDTMNPPGPAPAQAVTSSQFDPTTSPLHPPSVMHNARVLSALATVSLPRLSSQIPIGREMRVTEYLRSSQLAFLAS